MSTVSAYRWHLRQLMAARGMFATTELVPLLAAKGVSLSREQVYRLVVGTHDRERAVTDALDAAAVVVEVLRRAVVVQRGNRARDRMGGALGRPSFGRSPVPGLFVLARGHGAGRVPMVEPSGERTWSLFAATSPAT